MSWNSVDIEGRKMWEDSSGARVESWEQIEAVENSRKLPSPRQYPTWYEDETEDVAEPIHPAVVVLIFCGIVVVLLKLWLG